MLKSYFFPFLIYDLLLKYSSIDTLFKKKSEIHKYILSEFTKKSLFTSKRHFPLKVIFIIFPENYETEVDRGNF